MTVLKPMKFIVTQEDVEETNKYINELKQENERLNKIIQEEDEEED